jgi:hypothetical protein
MQMSNALRVSDFGAFQILAFGVGNFLVGKHSKIQKYLSSERLQMPTAWLFFLFSFFFFFW